MLAVAAQSEEVLKVGGGVSPPRILIATDPLYPEEARAVGKQGIVVLAVVIDREGIPRDIKVKKSLAPEMDAEAVKAVRDWKFSPAMKDGKPVSVLINVQVNFRLHFGPEESPGNSDSKK